MQAKELAVPKKQIAEAWGLHLEQLYLSRRYGLASNGEPPLEWARGLGRSAIDLTHPDELNQITQEFLKVNEQAGLVLEPEEKQLLLTTPWVHDLGELIIDNQGVGDVPAYRKTDADVILEKQMFAKVMENVGAGEEKELMLRAYHEVAMDKTTKLGRMFQTIELIDYVQTAIQAYQGIGGKRVKNWDWISGTVMSVAMPILLERQDEYQYARQFLEQNSEVISQIYAAVDLDKLGPGLDGQEDFRERFLQARQLWQERQSGLFAEFWQWEEKMLARSGEEIWQDESLPEKIRRILLLIKLELGTNPHVMVPAENLRDNLPGLVASLQALAWPDIGIITAPIADRPMGTWPMSLFKRENATKIEKSLRQYQQELEAIPQWRWEGSRLFVFANQFAEQNKIVGFRLMVKTPLRTPRRSREDMWVIEAAPRKMPRVLLSQTPGLIIKSYGRDEWVPRWGLVQLDDQVRTDFGLGLEQEKGLTQKQRDRLERLRNAAIRAIENRIMNDPNKRAAIAEMQRLIGSNELVFDGYFKSDGELKLFELEWVKRL